MRNKTLIMAVHYIDFHDPPDCPLYAMIKKKLKTYEGRKNGPNYRNIKIGDIIMLRYAGKGVLECRVITIVKTRSVREYLETVGLDGAFGNPDLCNISTIEEGVALYEQFVPREEIDRLRKDTGFGFLGFGIEFIAEHPDI